jgi:Asp-tRNA(Asn)/Glu-tRNA(Gln) amidotransferase A subunit family amidase
MCRSAEDCAIVLDAICGPDHIDHWVIDLPFYWDPHMDINKLRVGYIKSLFDLMPENDQPCLV